MQRQVVRASVSLGIAGAGDDSAEGSCPQKARRGSVGSHFGAIALAIADELSGQGTQPLRAAAHRPGDVRGLLREDERAGEGARVGQLRGGDETAARLGLADGDVGTRLSEIEVAALARAVRRSCEAIALLQTPARRIPGRPICARVR